MQQVIGPAIKSYIVTEVEGEEVFRNEIRPISYDIDDYGGILHPSPHTRVRVKSELIWTPPTERLEPEPIHISGDRLILEGLD